MISILSIGDYCIRLLETVCTICETCTDIQYFLQLFLQMATVTPDKMFHMCTTEDLEEIIKEI